MLKAIVISGPDGLMSRDQAADLVGSLIGRVYTDAGRMGLWGRLSPSQHTQRPAGSDSYGHYWAYAAGPDAPTVAAELRARDTACMSTRR